MSRRYVGGRRSFRRTGYKAVWRSTCQTLPPFARHSTLFQQRRKRKTPVHFITRSRFHRTIGPILSMLGFLRS